MRRGGAWLALLALAVLWPPLVQAQSQEYEIGPEDVLAISVYLHPELERTVAVGSDGNITFPPIGSIKAAGLTPKQLSDRLSERLASYLRQTTAVTVTVQQYLSRSVFVQGAVARPGRYGFERMPSLIEVLGQAGGASPGAELSRVEIVRREGTARRTLYADVASAMRDGSTGSIPELKPGDIIIIPGGAAPGAGGMLPVGEGCGVLGEVGRPGVYPVGSGQDVWAVLAAAGGMTQRGDLSKVRVITRDRGTQAIITLNLRQQLERGSQRTYVVKNGDILYVSPSGSSQFARAWTGFERVLSLSAQVLNLVLLRELIDERSEP